MVGICLRNVRTIFNEVKPAGVPYPFGKTKQGLDSIPKSKQTTQNYLANFEDDEKTKWANMLLPETEV